MSALQSLLSIGSVLPFESAALYWKKEDQAHHIIETIKLKKNQSNYYVTYGQLEKGVHPLTSIEVCNEAFVKVLIQNGNNVTLEKFNSGHDYLNWGETLAYGLIALNK